MILLRKREKKDNKLEQCLKKYDPKKCQHKKVTNYAEHVTT